MANNCFYMMKAVAPKREALDEHGEPIMVPAVGGYPDYGEWHI